MVQIIQSGPSSATLRQQALDSAIGNIVGGIGTIQKQDQAKALTLRQQALADQNATIELAKAGIDATPQDVRDYNAGNYKQKIITPAKDAVAAVTEQQDISGPMRPGEQRGSLTKILEPAQEAVPAVMGNKNPLMNYTEAKRAQVTAAADKIKQEKLLADTTIENKKADTAKKNEEANFIKTHKPEQVAAQVALSGQRENLINSQIGKNNAVAATAPSKAEAGTVKALNSSLTSMRGDTQAQLAQKAVVSADVAQGLLNKPQWTENDRNLFASELGKIATGGVPSQHEVESILPKTAAAQYSRAVTFLTSEPQNVNDDFYKKNAAHYLADLKKINQDYLDARNEKIFRINGFDKLSEETKNNYRGVPAFQNAISKIEGQKNSPTVAQASAHPQDQAAVQWAQANPNDPRAVKILQANGAH